jgi:TolB protein
LSRALTKDGLSRSPSWSPDGSRIAYVHGASPSRTKNIYVVAASGGDPTRLTQTAGDFSTPRWSPDWSRLAFTDCAVGNCDIFIVNADGSGSTNLTRSSTFDFDPSWSPDGARLAFSSYRDESQDIFVVDADGRNLRRLAKNVFGGWSSSPIWSPDGRHIAFAVNGALENRSGIYVVAAEGSTPAQITRAAPNWDVPSAWRR